MAVARSRVNVLSPVWTVWGRVPVAWRWQSERRRELRDANPFVYDVVVRVIAVLILLFIGWPLALLAAALFAIRMAEPSIDTFVGEHVPGRVGRWLSRRLAASLMVVVVLLVVATYPFYQENLGTMRLFGDYPAMETAVIMGVYAMMAVGLNIVVGYAGLLDLGYVAFYAIGAYTAAWLASLQFSSRKIHFGAVGVGSDVPGIHLSVWLILLIAAILTAIIGVIIGLPTLRLRGDYLAIVTLGFGEILPQVARNGDNLGGFNLTNGPNGITPIDAPGFGSTLHSWFGLPANYLTLENRNDAYFWTALVLVAITVFCSLRLRDSRLGRAWIAIREDEVAAAAMGIPLMRTKTWSYATGAFFGGIAGAYFAAFKSSTFPNDFSFNISAFILSMVILGGMGNVWGVLMGAGVLAYLNQEGLANIGASLNHSFDLSLDVPKYSAGIFGLILVVMMLVRPEGLIPSARRRAEFHEGVADQPLYDVGH